jgi:sortase (surface protein transpeptidase)
MRPLDTDADTVRIRLTDEPPPPWASTTLVDPADPDEHPDTDPEEHPDTDPEEHPATERALLRGTARVLGELLVTAGVVVLLFVVYEVYVTDLLAARAQDHLSHQLKSEWAAPKVPGTDPTQVPVGDGFAVLKIPRLGSDFSRVVVEGSGQDQLAQGPGHYVGTAMPGQPGNVAIAGHRVGKGSPFLDLDTLRPGDAIVVETENYWFTYRVLGNPATGDFSTDPSGIPGQEIVLPTALDVIAPTPDALGSAPTGNYLTLTTCHPKFSARQRMVIHAVQDGAPIPKVDAPNGPPALTGK